jgi:hypothetical protein
MPPLTRKQILAAEVFGYSYDNYANHLGDFPGMGNVRFEKLMPKDIDALERTERQGWDASRLAKALEIEEGKVELYRSLYREAKDIADAPTLVQSFRRGVRYSIEYALKEGLRNEGDVERLITQICYRAADLGYRLEVEGQRLSDLSQELRKESSYDVDAE